MLATMVFGFPYQAVRTLAVTLALVALLAGAVVATTPMLVVFLAFQKYFMKGIAMTGLKG